MSTKTQQGRRTPLSLSGVVTKSSNKNANNAASSSGNNANGHTTSNTNKQDNKLQQQKIEIPIINNADTKENPNKKQQSHAEKKQQQIDNKKSNDKNENGVSNNKQQQFNENKQQHQQNKDQQQQNKCKQQQNKDKQQQNGNDDKNVNDKNKKEKTEKPDKLEKQDDESEKVDIKLNEEKNVDQEKLDNKKEETKTKEIKYSNEDKNEGVSKSDTKTEQLKNGDNILKEGNQLKNEKNDQKSEEKTENKDVGEEHQQSPQKSSTPGTPQSNSNANKTLIPVNKTPTKLGENPPQKSVPINSAKVAVVTKREITTSIDDNDIEMEPLAIESSPIKLNQRDEVAHINLSPSATSTPGKILLQKRSPKSDVKLDMQADISPERPRPIGHISGRKSIRPISDFTPSKFQSNLQYRESYRRINTELDVTNTSMNVTVGSEVPSNLSLSFFGRGRKRDHTPPRNSQSAIGDLQANIEISPPKKARLDMQGFFSVVSSPISLLRNRFSKTSLKSSTPVKLQQKLNSDEDEIEVQNVSGVSGVSVHDEISKPDTDDNDAALREAAKENKLKSNIAKCASIEADPEGKEFTDVSLKSEKSCGIEQACEASDIKITETLLQNVVGDPVAKNKRCIVM